MTPGCTRSAQCSSVSASFFCLGVVVLNHLLLRSRLVPRALPVWALVAVVPYLADGLLAMVNRLEITSTAHTLLILPLALYEMAFALWLLIKGFNPASAPALATADRAA